MCVISAHPWQHGYHARIYVLDHLTEVVFRTQKGLILDASDSCVQMFGCTAEQLKGKPFQDLLETMSPDTTGKPWNTRCLTADGGQLDVVVNALQMQDSDVVRYHVSNAEKKGLTKTSSDEDLSETGSTSFEEGSSNTSISGTSDGTLRKPEDLGSSLGLYSIVSISHFIVVSFLILVRTAFWGRARLVP